MIGDGLFHRLLFVLLPAGLGFFALLTNSASRRGPTELPPRPPVCELNDKNHGAGPPPAYNRLPYTGTVGTAAVNGESTVWVREGAEPLIAGALAVDDVRRTIASKLHEVRYCFESSVPSAAVNTSGHVDVELVINASGTVSSVSITEATMKTAIESCLVSRLWTWSFPVTTDGRAALLRYRFIFATTWGMR